MSTFMRRIFRLVNRFFMVPVFRLGLGPLFGNPLTGYIMVLKAIGRKTGKVRCAPVNYTIHQGHVYCISGGGRTSDWYRNLMADPDVEILLPAGPIYVHVVEVDDRTERLVALRQVLKNAGFAGFFEGYNPYTIQDAELAEKTSELPVLRFQPIGLANGACDPGGWAWIWSLALTALIIYLLLR